MTDNFFRIGDVVILKGNDKPRMTVTSLRPVNHCGGEHVQTKWFDGGECNAGVFHQNTLILIPKDEL